MARIPEPASERPHPTREPASDEMRASAPGVSAPAASAPPGGLWSRELASTPRMTAQRQRICSFTQPHPPNPSSTQPVAQLALPPSGKAETNGFYNPRENGKLVPFDGERPTFSTTFREKLVRHWAENNQHGIVTSGREHKTYIRTVPINKEGFANWMPFESFNLDHKYAWNNISQDMDARAEQFSSVHAPQGWEKDYYVQNGKSGYAPSAYGARMYFHDIDNIQPMQVSDNASKSDKLGDPDDDDKHKIWPPQQTGNALTSVLGTPSSLSSSSTVHPRLDELNEAQRLAEATITMYYTELMDSLQHAFRTARNAPNDASTAENVLQGYREGGSVLGDLRKLTSNTSAETFGLPRTPQKLNPKVGTAHMPTQISELSARRPRSKSQSSAPDPSVSLTPITSSPPKASSAVLPSTPNTSHANVQAQQQVQGLPLRFYGNKMASAQPLSNDGIQTVETTTARDRLRSNTLVSYYSGGVEATGTILKTPEPKKGQVKTVNIKPSSSTTSADATGSKASSSDTSSSKGSKDDG